MIITSGTDSLLVGARPRRGRAVLAALAMLFWVICASTQWTRASEPATSPPPATVSERPDRASESCIAALRGDSPTAAATEPEAAGERAWDAFQSQRTFSDRLSAHEPVYFIGGRAARK